jgi:hypothetical protein
MAWRPIVEAPKTRPDLETGPMIILASAHGHRAVGYWGANRDGREGWVNPHDHLVMEYWNAFTHWMPLEPLALE